MWVLLGWKAEEQKHRISISKEGVRKKQLKGIALAKDQHYRYSNCQKLQKEQLILQIWPAEFQWIRLQQLKAAACMPALTC